YGRQRHELVFAVNVPAVGPTGSESDLRRLTAEEFRFLTSDDAQVVTSLGDLRRSPRRPPDADATPSDALPPMAPVIGPGVARIVLLALLTLLVIEGVLAWRFGSARAGTATALDQPKDTAQRRVRDRLYALAAAAPLVICLVGGLLLCHA